MVHVLFQTWVCPEMGNADKKTQSLCTLLVLKVATLLLYLQFSNTAAIAFYGLWSSEKSPLGRFSTSKNHLKKGSIGFNTHMV